MSGQVRSGQVPGMMSSFCKRNGGGRSAGDSDWRMRCWKSVTVDRREEEEK